MTHLAQLCVACWCDVQEAAATAVATASGASSLKAMCLGQVRALARSSTDVESLCRMWSAWRRMVVTAFAFSHHKVR